MNIKIKTLRTILSQSIAEIDSGNCNLSEEEIESIIDSLSSINKEKKRVSKVYACKHILHINSNKFDYLQRKGVIPQGRKDKHFNELSYSLKDFDEAIKYINAE